MGNMTVNYHAKDDTRIKVDIRHREEDGSAYFVIDVGPNMNGVTIFASPEFVDRLAAAIAWQRERVPTEAEAMFIGMVEKELGEEGSCP